MLASNNDSHPHNMIKSESDKMYHFAAAHHLNKSQILSDSKMPPPQMFDVRNADGQIVHVNIEDINQFLTYHEVFGKISGGEHFPTSSTTAQPPSLNLSNQSNPQLNAVIAAQQQLNANQGNQNNQTTPTPLIIPKIESIPSNMNVDGANTATTTSTTNTSTTSVVNSTAAADDAAAMPSPAIHTCDICGKMFPFKYQFIVHRRYHNERKPFICQVCCQETIDY